MKQSSAVQKQKYPKVKVIWLSKSPCSAQYLWEQHYKSTV